MKKQSIITGVLSMILAGGAIAGVGHLAITAPEYYVNDAGSCATLSFETGCTPGGNGCLRTVTGQTGTKQIYDDRNAQGICITPLIEAE